MTNERPLPKLLQIGAIKLSPQQPFPGPVDGKSPIYCDNRKSCHFHLSGILLKVNYAV